MYLQNPIWLILALPLAWAVWRAAGQRPPTVTVSDLRPYKAERQTKLAHWPRLHPVRWPLYLCAVGAFSLIIALSRPRRELDARPPSPLGTDIVLVLDLSGSMRYLYDDIDEAWLGRPLRTSSAELDLASRLEVAIGELSRFIESRPHDRIGLIAFARTPYLVSPPTPDLDFLLANLRLLEEARLPDGTGIAAATLSALARLREAESPQPVVVLFSDGAESVPFPVGSRAAARLAREYGIVIHTVGIGGRQTYSLRNTLAGSVLVPTSETFDRELLEDMAEITGGRFWQAGRAEEMQAAMREIDQAITIPLDDHGRRVEYREAYQGWAAAGLVMILLAIVLEKTVCRRLP